MMTMKRTDVSLRYYGAKRFGSRGNIEVWYFDITPEMRQDFMENGIPLTQNGDDDDNEQERMVA